MKSERQCIVRKKLDSDQRGCEGQTLVIVSDAQG
jgi:hypothetical protein